MNDFFDAENVINYVDNDMIMKETLNYNLGREKHMEVKRLLRRLFQNAEKNHEMKSKQGYRHDKIIKDFAAALYCLIGRSGRSGSCKQTSVADFRLLIQSKG